MLQIELLESEDEEAMSPVEREKHGKVRDALESLEKLLGQIYHGDSHAGR